MDPASQDHEQLIVLVRATGPHVVLYLVIGGLFVFSGFLVFGLGPDHGIILRSALFFCPCICVGFGAAQRFRLRRVVPPPTGTSSRCEASAFSAIGKFDELCGLGAAPPAIASCISFMNTAIKAPPGRPKAPPDQADRAALLRIAELAASIANTLRQPDRGRYDSERQLKQWLISDGVQFTVREMKPHDSLPSPQGGHRQWPFGCPCVSVSGAVTLIGEAFLAATTPSVAR
jgi:hypothetical protein